MTEKKIIFNPKLLLWYYVVNPCHWAMSLKKDVDKVERIQQRATKKYLKSGKHDIGGKVERTGIFLVWRREDREEI